MDAMKPSLSSSTSTLRTTKPLPVRLDRYYSNALLCRSRERSDRRIRTVPVANARQHDALYSLFHQEINYFGAEIFVGVDNLYTRQVARSLSVNCKFTLGCVAGRVLRKELDLTYIHHASATAVWGMEGI